jgi:hypothetical protein
VAKRRSATIVLNLPLLYVFKLAFTASAEDPLKEEIKGSSFLEAFTISFVGF